MKNNIIDLKIDRFRGLKDLNLKNLKDINIILGDNNSGKTSLLEAILLMSNNSLGNILITCSKRNSRRGFGTYFTEFNYAFPRYDEKMNIQMSCEFLSKDSYSYSLNGNIEEVIFDMSSIDKNLIDIYNFIKSNNNSQTTLQFKGALVVQKNNEIYAKQPILVDAYSGLKSETIKEKKKIFNAVYLSPFDYAGGLMLGNIIENDKYKEICIEVLKVFDSNIEDLLVKYNEFEDPIDYVKTKNLGTMPLSTFGDGIKKVLNIASGIAKARNGILLIDEFEAAIHAKNYDDIFKFIVKACKEFNVQLFITTHSKEAVDALLNIKNVVELNDANFITLRKDFSDNKTYARIMSGKEVKENRENFNFEVRL